MQRVFEPPPLFILNHHGVIAVNFEVAPELQTGRTVSASLCWGVNKLLSRVSSRSVPSRCVNRCCSTLGEGLTRQELCDACVNLILKERGTSKVDGDGDNDDESKHDDDDDSGMVPANNSDNIAGRRAAATSTVSVVTTPTPAAIAAAAASASAITPAASKTLALLSHCSINSANSASTTPALTSRRNRLLTVNPTPPMAAPTCTAPDTLLLPPERPENAAKSAAAADREVCPSSLLSDVLETMAATAEVAYSSGGEEEDFGYETAARKGVVAVGVAEGLLKKGEVCRRREQMQSINKHPTKPATKSMTCPMIPNNVITKVRTVKTKQSEHCPSYVLIVAGCLSIEFRPLGIFWAKQKSCAGYGALLFGTWKNGPRDFAQYRTFESLGLLLLLSLCLAVSLVFHALPFFTFLPATQSIGRPGKFRWLRGVGRGSKGLLSGLRAMRCVLSTLFPFRPNNGCGFSTTSPRQRRTSRSLVPTPKQRKA